MATTVFILVFSLVSVCVMTVSGTEPQNPIVKALRSFESEEEKIDFLKFHLLRGMREWAESQPRPPKFLIMDDKNLLKSLNISEANAAKLENSNIPEESSRKLFAWTKSEFNLSTRNILELVKSKKCHRPPCLPDIGELCCPW